MKRGEITDRREEFEEIAPSELNNKEGEVVVTEFDSDTELNIKIQYDDDPTLAIHWIYWDDVFEATFASHSLRFSSIKAAHDLLERFDSEVEYRQISYDDDADIKMFHEYSGKNWTVSAYGDTHMSENIVVNGGERSRYSDIISFREGIALAVREHLRE